MPEIKLSLEGEDVDVAAQDLFETTGLQGSWVTPDSSTTKEGTLAVIGTVVGIIGGTVAVAEQVRQWYLKYKKSKKKFNAVLVVDDIRLVLEDATAEDICTVLEELSS